MKSFKVEYFIIFRAGDTVCNSEKTFKNLLETDSRVEIRSNKLIKFDKEEFEYKLTAGEIEEKKQAFFQLEVICQKEEKEQHFRGLLKTIRSRIKGAGGLVNELWDDFGIHYANLAYPLINGIENLLRKLISKFMLANIGPDWAKATLPDTVRSAVNMNKRENSNPLYKVDFIHLADFLFSPYQTQATLDLYDKIRKAKNITDLELNEIKAYLPRSNWERYFKKVVESEDASFNKKWSRLYELRCSVAHNNFIQLDEYNEIKSLTTELETLILTAINKLDQVAVPEDEKEQIVENVATNLRFPKLSFESFNPITKLTKEEIDALFNATKINFMTKLTQEEIDAMLNASRINFMPKLSQDDIDALLDARNNINWKPYLDNQGDTTSRRSEKDPNSDEKDKKKDQDESGDEVEA